MYAPGPPPGPPPGWSPQGGHYPGGPPAGPYGPPPQGPPPGGPFPPARPQKSGPPVALIVIVVLVVLLGCGGAAYLATVSSGRYPKLIWACVLMPPGDVASLVPHGLPEGTPPTGKALDSSCHWSNLAALNAGLEKQDAGLNIRIQRYGRGLLSSGEKEAHKWLRFKADGSPVRHPGVPISGYGDEAVRISRAYGGEFDAIVFRDSNVVVEVAAEVDDHPDPQAALAWNRTQRAATLVQQRLRALRP